MKTQCDLENIGAYWLCSGCGLAQHDSKPKPQCKKMTSLEENTNG